MEGKGGGLADHLRRSTDVQLAYAEESEVWVLLLTEATPVRSSLVFGWCACRNRGQGSLCIQAFYPSASIFIGAGGGVLLSLHGSSDLIRNTWANSFFRLFGEGEKGRLV